MSNPKANGGELENNGNGVTASLNTYQKRAPAASKNIVQNENTGVSLNNTEKSVALEGRANLDFLKLDESMKTVPECPPPSLSSTSSSFAVPRPQNPIRSHDTSFGLAPASSSMAVPCATPSVPVSLIKPANPWTSIESNHRDYIQKMLRMTPTELSRHAVELENRSMQITRAANREIHRKAALSIKLAQPPSRREQGASHSAK